MRKLLLAIVLLTLGWGANAQIAAPSTLYFEGPSIGQKWEPSNSFNAGVNAQTGTTYTVLATDMGKLITFNNAGAVAVTVPAATTPGFGTSKMFEVLNLGAGTVTMTPTTSTVNGAATKTYAQNVGGTWVSDGTNYFAW